VSLPLLRALPKTGDSNASSNTQRSATSIIRETDESVSQLRAQVVGQTVSLHGFDIDSTDVMAVQTAQLLKASVERFLTDWYGLTIVTNTEAAEIVVVNEGNSALISKLSHPSLGRHTPPTVVVLCSHASRFDRATPITGTDGNVGYVAKPIGPLKFARAILACLPGSSETVTPGLTPGISTSTAAQNNSDLSNVFEELSISPGGAEVLDNSRMAAYNNNTRMVIESPTPNATLDDTEEFPFPNDRPIVAKTLSMPSDQETLGKIVPEPRSHRASVILTEMEKSATINNFKVNKATNTRSTAPRLLLVDDNKINLRLLRTYMRKREYQCIDEAENGLEAVNAVQAREDGYDIIFMDISMPVLDGFGATRQIRQIEQTRREKFSMLSPINGTGEAEENGSERKFSPALIIALTGLASSRDQNEAFTSGIDLFLTKPVSFKEVGKMLDNWEANCERGRESTEGN
jgi:CheY-like chemotaxis protein